MMMHRFSLVLVFALCALALEGCFKEERWYTEVQVAAGKPLFETHCMSCHGVAAAGLGDDWQAKLPGFPHQPPALNGSAHAWHHPLKALLYTINAGGVPLGGQMPAFGDKLSEDEKLAIIAYFQSFWNDETYEIWKQVDDQSQ